VKPVSFHPSALEFIRMQSTQIRHELGEAIRDLQDGMSLGMPLSRPMPSVASGVHELRVKDAAVAVRVFYVTKTAHTIVVFHAFEKRTDKTPEREIKLAQQRLREMVP